VIALPLVGLAQTPTQTATPPPAVQAKPPAEIVPAKIAFLDLNRAIAETAEGKRDFAALQQFVEQKNQELRALQKESSALQEQLQVQGDKLTNEARTDLEYQVQTKGTQLQRFQQDTQAEIENRRVRVTNQIGSKMLPIIEQISRLKGLQAVFYINPARDGWVDPNLIITGEIIAAFDKAHPAAGAAAAPPANTP
jgi:Skp family chaperone for outer membrane proteins